MTLEIDPVFVEKILTLFIREELKKFGFRKGILGLSGGLDSAACAALAALALGPRNVLALILPYGETFAADIRHAESFARKIGIVSRKIDIAPQVDPYFKAYPTTNKVLIGNKMARERMSILYDVSAREKALILGTSNKTELLIGYGTIHGDMACAINPMGDLYKTQVRRLAAHLRIPRPILAKVPTAGLWPGQTDESEIGLSYAEIDEILFGLVERRRSERELIMEGFPARSVRKIAELVRTSEFKRKLPPIAKLHPRSVGHDFLYPYDRGR